MGREYGGTVILSYGDFETSSTFKSLVSQTLMLSLRACLSPSTNLLKNLNPPIPLSRHLKISLFHTIPPTNPLSRNLPSNPLLGNLGLPGIV